MANPFEFLQQVRPEARSRADREGARSRGEGQDRHAGMAPQRGGMALRTGHQQAREGSDQG